MKVNWALLILAYQNVQPENLGVVQIRGGRNKRCSHHVITGRLC